MPAKPLAAAVAVASLAAGPGCVTHHHGGYAASLAACHHADPQFPASVRQRVYLFALAGADVLDLADLGGLRDQVCAAGYPKVYLAQMLDAGWYHREVRRVARDDPHARLVFLAVGSAAGPAGRLAAAAAADGLAVDAVVFLDPTGGPPAGPLPFHRLVVHSFAYRPGPEWAEAEVVAAGNVGFYGLPNGPRTVRAVVGVLAASAAKVGPVDPGPLPLPPPADPTPTPRPTRLLRVGPPDEWDFLAGPPRPTSYAPPAAPRPPAAVPLPPAPLPTLPPPRPVGP